MDQLTRIEKKLDTCISDFYKDRIILEGRITSTSVKISLIISSVGVLIGFVVNLVK